MNAKELAASIYARLKDGDRHVEEQRVDLKSKWYAFGGTGGANADEEFAKDVCAMANAGVIAPAYLLFGLSPEPPHLCPAGLPLDEASLQQKLGSKIAPPPTVAFEEFVLDGARISTATIIGQAEHLPYGARRNDGWTYWVRFGSSTRPATPHDIESLFRLRYQARQRPEPRIVIPDGKLVWSHHFDTVPTPPYRWHPPNAGPRPNTWCVSGVATRLQILNSGEKATAFTDLKLVIGKSVVSDAVRVDREWPLHIQSRGGIECKADFIFDERRSPGYGDLDLAVLATDLEGNEITLPIKSSKITRHEPNQGAAPFDVDKV